MKHDLRAPIRLIFTLAIAGTLIQCASVPTTPPDEHPAERMTADAPADFPAAGFLTGAF